MILSPVLSQPLEINYMHFYLYNTYSLVLKLGNLLPMSGDEAFYMRGKQIKPYGEHILLNHLSHSGNILSFIVH